LQSSYSREPFTIRRLLTEGAVRASDKRARFIGDTYEAEGGAVLRDLFQGDDGGWLQDVALVNRLVAERLEREAEAVRAEGWKWIEVAPDFPYGHTYGLRQLRGEVTPLAAEEEAAQEALQAEYDRLEEEYETVEELPEEVDRRFAELETLLAAFERPVLFDPADMARAGAFASIDGDGSVRVERGYVRPEDEQIAVREPEADTGTDWDSHDGSDAESIEAEQVVALRTESDRVSVAAGATAAPEPEEDDGLKPLPDRLLSELTAHRTLALRVALGEDREVAFLAALHALCLKLFYPYALDTCLELDVKSVGFQAQAPGLNDTALAGLLAQRHQDWAARLPREAEALWDTLAGFGELSRQVLFAHCVALSVNAVFEPYTKRPRALAHADRLAQAVDLDMAASWAPTVENYLGRVTKARILQAVREASVPGSTRPEPARRRSQRRGGRWGTCSGTRFGSAEAPTRTSWPPARASRRCCRCAARCPTCRLPPHSRPATSPACICLRGCAGSTSPPIATGPGNGRRSG
jgi:ParB family chromosome partitioning protein